MLLGELAGSKDQVAIKVFDLSPNEEPALRNKFNHEVSLLEKLHHPNVVKMRENIVKNNKLYIVMELAGKSTLSDIIRKSSNSALEEKSRRLLTSRGSDFRTSRRSR